MIYIIIFLILFLNIRKYIGVLLISFPFLDVNIDIDLIYYLFDLFFKLLFFI